VEPAAESPEAEAEAGRVARTTKRLKAEQSRLTQRIEDTRDRLERSRPNSALIDAGFRALDRDVATGGVVLAGAVAFRIFLFLVPYVFVAVVGFGVAAEAADQDAGDLAREAGIGGLIAKAVGGAADLSGFARVSALVVGLIALVFGTRALLKVLRIVYGLIWGVTPAKPKRPAIAMVAVLALTAILFIFAGVVDHIGERSFALGLVGIFVLSLIPFAVTVVASFYLPRQPTRWPELVPGALFLTLGVFVLHIVTVYWIAHQVESKTDTYGAIGAALALLLWSYLLGRLITASAVINASLWQRREDRAERRAARARMHPGSPVPGAGQRYTPAARPESAPSHASREEGTDGRAERRN
jgi:membrane protein